MKDSTQRFSNRVENYVKYRPGYPSEVLKLFRDEMGLTTDSVIADIGSGTGISAKMFLENGNRVFGVEPNASMRAASDEFLKDYPNFTSIGGTATDTTLAENSINFVTAFQAFHWFEGKATRDEFERILKPGGYVALIWNERKLGATPFLVEYEALLLEYAGDYEVVRHEKTGPEVIREFFGKEYQTAVFENSQVFDFDGLKGRVMSSSYMPSADDPAAEPMLKDLRSLFTKYEENGRITILYDTRVSYSTL